MKGYANPDVLVSTQWVAEHLDDPTVRLVESNEDILLYDLGHIPGAVQIDWQKDLNDAVRRDYLTRQDFEVLMAINGIGNDTTVVFYGDKNNWWATYAFWVFQLFGHSNARVMDGGRAKWEAEGRPMTKVEPAYPKTVYRAQARADYKIRAYRDQVLAHVQAGLPLVDVRSPAEYPTIPRRARCAAVTSPARRTCPGRGRPTPTAPSRARTSCAPSTRPSRVSSPTTPW
jgi:thiosulfate/3-mercaptopyruvate sulfurtransferase